MSARVVVNRANLVNILRTDAAPTIRRIADRVADTAASLAGTVDGRPVVMDRDDGDTGQRFRSAIIVHHPTPAGRRAGSEALQAALRVAGE